MTRACVGTGLVLVFLKINSFASSVCYIEKMSTNASVNIERKSSIHRLEKP